MGRLSRFPLGPFLIDFLGHMGADARLRQSFLDISFPTTVGLSPWLDTRVVALEALSRFGVGFIEIGPVALQAITARPVRLLQADDSLWVDSRPANISLVECNRRLHDAGGVRVPVIVRLGLFPEEEADDATRQLLYELSAEVSLVTISSLVLAIDSGWTMERWSKHLDLVVESKRKLLLCVDADQNLQAIAALIDQALRKGIAGLLVDGSIEADASGRAFGPLAREQALQQVRLLRERYGASVPIVASGGIHEPEQALGMLAAGANLAQLDTGLIYTGPGLPKRVNDCLLFAATNKALQPARSIRAPELTWFWTAPMGAGMFIGGLLALAIAATKVILPYDEAYLGTLRATLTTINPRLLLFMAHDRVTLAGVMVAIGLLYVSLSVFGIRRGLHWARQTVFISAFTGFASFFLFLGFGYLDTFHAFVTAVLLQLLLLGVHSRLGDYTPIRQPDLRGDRTWLLSLWGQLLLVVHGFALLGAGAVISSIGVTQVFVHEDLEFLGTTAPALASANARLVPLVAHDRATLGGMLLASGWVFLLPALWGYRRGSSWLWWTLLIAGSIAYFSAIGVHQAVGYLSLKHLLPAFAGFALLLLGLILSYPFLGRGKPGGK